MRCSKAALVRSKFDKMGSKLNKARVEFCKSGEKVGFEKKNMGLKHEVSQRE